MTDGTDTAVRLPVLRDLTYNEAHSALLGLIGTFAGVAFQIDAYRKIAAGFTVVVVLVAFGLRRLQGEHLPVARRIIQREPWYFLTVYVVTAAVAGLAYTRV